jgi:isopenicillin N synthase-like dioxygenase
VPVLDISDFQNAPHGPSGRCFVDHLRLALHQTGFAHIVGHGIDPQLEAQLLEQATQFFHLPQAERNELAIGNSAAFRGYTILGDEQTAGTRDWRHQLDFGPEQVPPEAKVPAWLRLRGPNQWPPSLPALSSVSLQWLDAMLELGLDLLRAIAIGLDLAADHFDEYFIPQHDLHAKLIHYPATTTESGQGVGPHHDSGLLTFILQNGVAGLEVEIDGAMHLVEPLDGAYVMNLGAMMQSATSGYLRATPHRVVSPQNDLDRISAALFFNPAFESTFDPVPLPDSLAGAARPDMTDLKGEAIHTLFGENNLKVRLRSHPDVARRHYGDVLEMMRTQGDHETQ